MLLLGVNVIICVNIFAHSFAVFLVVNACTFCVAGGGVSMSADNSKERNVLSAYSH